LIDPIFNTDKVIESIKSLEFVSEQLIICNTDSYHWKWALIGIHNALQSFIILSLVDGTDRKVIKEDSRKKYDNKIRRRKFGSEPEEISSLLKLYKDRKNYWVKKIEYFSSSSEYKILKELNDIRNDLIHNSPPMGKSYLVLDLLKFFNTPIEIIEILLKNTVLLLNPTERNTVNNLILVIKEHLQSFQDVMIGFPPSRE